MFPGDRVYVRLPSGHLEMWVTHIPATLVELANTEASVRLQSGTRITVKRRQVLTKHEFRQHLLSTTENYASRAQRQRRR